MDGKDIYDVLIDLLTTYTYLLGLKEIKPIKLICYTRTVKGYNYG